MKILRGMSIAVAIIGLFWLTTPGVGGVARLVQLILAGLAGLACILAHRIPLGSAAVAATATIIGWALHVTTDPLLLAAPAFFVLGDQRGRRPFPRWILIVIVVLSGAIMLIEGAELGLVLRTALLGTLASTAAWALGVSGRESRQHAAEQAREHERARLTRDVHDVLSHALGSIGVRAGVIAHVDAERPERLRAALEDIAAQTREALTELRGLLADRVDVISGGLRSELLKLRARAHGAGIDMDVDVDAGVDQMPAHVGTVIYRVAQEAITNVIRHSGARRAGLSVHLSDGGVRVDVWDDGVLRPPLTEGNGLKGMYERVQEVGGVLTVEADVGITIRAVIPVEMTA